MKRNDKVAPLYLDHESGNLVAEIILNDRISQLQVDPDILRFTIVLPDGSKINDKVIKLDSYEKLIRSHENNLYEILRSTIRSHQFRIDKGLDELQVKIPMEGHQYKLTFNVHTGNLKLFMPEYYMIADRDKLIDSFPELQKMEYGTVQSILIDQLIEAQPVFLSNTEVTPCSTLPVQVVNPKEYLIGEFYYRIQYIVERDVCFVKVPDRVANTHTHTIVRDIPEIENLHGGKLISAIEDELSRHGMKLEY